MSDPTWLAEVLRAQGLSVRVLDGAYDRGHGDFGAIWGVVGHHTGDPTGRADNPWYIADHPDLGLASQLHLNRAGVWTLCGVGIAWHAGAGSWPGIARDNANAVTIGIEAENSGTEGWTPAQYDAYVSGVAAILNRLGHNSSRFIGHREWYHGRALDTATARRLGGKWDPGGIDLNLMRTHIQRKIDRKDTDDMTPDQARQLAYIAAQLGPWPQLGRNAKGQNLTLVDAVADSRARQSQIEANQRAIMDRITALEARR